MSHSRPPDVSGQAPAPGSFEHGLDQLFGEAPLSADFQLGVMQDFLERLERGARQIGKSADLPSLIIPDMGAAQSRELAQTAQTHPGNRVVPTILMDQTRPSLPMRKAIVAGARSFDRQQFIDKPEDEVSALRGPDEEVDIGKGLHPYAAILMDPHADKPVRYKGELFRLFYKRSGDNSEAEEPKIDLNEMVDRSSFVETLLESGRAIEAKDGAIWVFPVMDIQVNSPRTKDTASNLYRRIDPVNVPESLLIVSCLHQANGTPNTTGDIDYANEALWKVKKTGDPITDNPDNVVTVRFRSDRRRVGLFARIGDSVRDNAGVRDTVSGLGTTPTA